MMGLIYFALTVVALLKLRTRCSDISFDCFEAHAPWWRPAHEP
jgi:hypothetical protein